MSCSLLFSVFIAIICRVSSKVWLVGTKDECPVKSMGWRGMADVTKPASTWEKCGNLCYQDTQHCKVGWTWTELGEYEGSCALFSKAKLGLQEDAISGSRGCPVEDCDHHHFESWWDVVSPCFKKRVERKMIDNPELCLPEPNTAMRAKIDQSVMGLNTTVHNSQHYLLALANKMYLDVPEDYAEYCPGDFTAMISYLKIVAMIPPPFLIDAPNYIGVPITTILLCYLHTQAGRKFFANSKVNEHMLNIVNVHAELLSSPDSLAVFNDGQYGWNSTCARRLVQYEQFQGGFQSYNDFFIRQFKDIKAARPVDTGDYVLVSPGDAKLSYTATDVDYHHPLYIKSEKYSLKHIFNSNSRIAKKFIGGAIIQVYFQAHKYHWYHSTVAGKLTYARRVPGIIYAIDEVNAAKNNNLTHNKRVTPQKKLELWLEHGQEGLIDTPFYLAHIATRCIFIVDSPHLGQVAMVFIGMTEISSCTMLKEEGDTVEKGEALGHFQYGGSSGVIIVEKDIVESSKVGDSIWESITGTWLVGQKIVDLTPAA